MKSFNLSRWAIEHPALVRYLMVALMLLGIGSYFQLGQDEDPPFNFRVMVVQANWPGATAMQMANQVADRLERIIQEVPNTRKITSFSKPGHTTVIVEISDDFDPKEVPQRFYAIRKKMMDMAGTLPQGVQGPFFNDDFGDTYGIVYAVSSPGLGLARQNDLARELRGQMLRVPNVGKVEIFGLEPERVYIELSRAKLARYGLTTAQISAQINAQNRVVQAGAIRAMPFEIPLRVLGQFQSVEQIAQTPIRAGTQILRLADLGDIRRGPQDPSTQLMRVNGQPVFGLGVSMKRGGDVIALGRSMSDLLSKIRQDLPVGVTVTQVQDQPGVVGQSVGEFLKVLAEALAIVLGVSLLALGLHQRPLRIDPRPGLIVAISIPLVMATTFLIMKAWGIGLHKISLGSLIIALGLLVDDAIIVVEMMVRKLEEGADRLTAATAAYELTAIPMLTGTLITAAGFLPIGIAKSTVGEYTFAIFGVTAAALLVSWLVSVFFVPVLGYWLLKAKPVSHQSPSAPTGFYHRFRLMVTWCVDHAGWVLAATVLSFVLGLVGMSKVQQQFFPDSSRPEMLVDVFLQEGASIEATQETVKALEAVIMRDPGHGSLTSWLGSGAPRFFLPLDIIFPQPNVAQLIVLPKPGENRQAMLARLQAQLPDAAPQARLRIKLLPNGPPVPYPVQLRLVSDRPELIETWAPRVAAVMRAHPDVRGLNSNWNERRPVVQINLDLPKARDLGVSPESIADTLAARFSGVTVGEFREADRLLPIVLRLPEQERNRLEDLRGLLIPSQSGQQVALSRVASIGTIWEPGIVWRQNRSFAMTLQSAVVPGRQGPTVTAALLKDLEPVVAGFPTGLRLEVGGEVEESGRGQASIFAGMPIMLFITLTLLVLQLQSSSRSFMVLATAPLGLAGAAAMLLILNRPFGFVALLGVIALMGMIMRNSVILIDQIERERRVHDLRTAIVEATVSRFRPILLTAAAAVLAMVPLQSSIFWGPMAVAIMGGLIVATALTLFSLPALYAAVYLRASLRRDPAG
ncbi:MAG: hypothetical protein RL483_1119 [Pseudomonadota bacterium]